MLYDRRPCQPLCRPPDKRDFMDYKPERTASDFYASYDPMVGVGTAAILLAFMVMLTAKSLLRWTLKHWRLRKYAKKRDREGGKTVTIEVRPSTKVLKTEPMGASMGNIHPNGDVL